MPLSSQDTVEVERVPGARLVPIAGDFALPERFEATISPADDSLPVCRLALGVEDGQVVVNAVMVLRRLGEPTLAPLSVRVPLARYRDLATDAIVRHVALATDNPEGAVTMTMRPGDEPVPMYGTQRLDDGRVAVPAGGLALTRGWRDARKRPVGRPGGKVRLTDQHLEEVADVYKRAHGKRQRPTQAVMVEWEVPRSTASRWVRLAREAGHLGPAKPRQAG